MDVHECRTRHGPPEVSGHALLEDAIAEQEDIRGNLLFAIQSLPPKWRSVVFLRYREELSFGEIGRRLNMPENTVKVYYRRALPRLRASRTQSAG